MYRYTHTHMYVVRHKNCLPAVKCRNGLSETFPIFKNHLGICSDVSGPFHVISLGISAWALQ